MKVYELAKTIKNILCKDYFYAKSIINDSIQIDFHIDFEFTGY